MILGSILSSVTSAVGGYLENKSKEAQAKSQLKQVEIQSKAKIEEEIVKGNADAMRLKAEWESKAIENTGMRDEFVTLVVLTPCILVFFPSLQHYVLQGFDILKTLPSWYVNLIYITVCAGLGLKGVGGISKYMKRK